MAEAVGTVASVLTLLDFTVNTLRLLSKFRDAPSVVRDLAFQTKQLQQVIGTIEINDALDVNRDPLQAILRTCLSDLLDFQEHLRRLSSAFDDAVIGKSWKTVMGVVKEKQYLRMMNTIEGHKSSLLLCLQNESM